MPRNEPTTSSRKGPSPSAVEGEQKPLLNNSNNSNSNQSGYKYGDGAETDDFISGLTGRKPRAPPRPAPPAAAATYEASNDTQSVVSSNYYNPNYAAMQASKVCGIEDCRSRALMVAISVFIMGGGATLIAMLNTRGNYLQDLWPLSYFAMNVVGAVYIIGSIMSIIAAAARRDMYRRAAFFILALACCGVILGFVLVTLIKNGSQDSKLLADWEQMVGEDPNRVCTVLHDLNCTGWTVPCPSSSSAVSPSSPAPSNSSSNATNNSTVSPAPQQQQLRGSSHVESATGGAATVNVHYRRLMRSYRESGLEFLHELAAHTLGNSSNDDNALQCLPPSSSCVLNAYHNVNQTCSIAMKNLVSRDYPIAVSLLAFGIVFTVIYGIMVYVRRDKPTGYGSLQA